MSKNVAIYKSQAAALEKNAKKDCKVVVVANPANTNALILKEHAPSIPAENITCLTRLDHNRAIGQLSERSGTHNAKVKNVIIWGNHSEVYMRHFVNNITSSMTVPNHPVFSTRFGFVQFFRTF
jgi:malate dehydrogenase